MLNRLTTKSSSNSGSGSGCGTQVNVTNTYDQGANGKGRRTGMTDSGADSADSGQASAAWTYDARGRMTSETRVISGQSFTTSTTYNSADQPVSMTYPDGEVVTNSYNPQMLLNSVSGANPYVQSSTYDIAGRLTLRTLGNGLTQKYLYNEWNSPQGGGRLQSINTGAWNGTAFTSKIQNLSYNYDAVGNVFSINSNLDGIPFNADDETQFYYYDGLDRLTSWQLGSQTETYIYNSATGNLQTKAGVTLNYDDVNHTHAVSSTSTNNTYGYDANGNQTTRTVNGQPIITLAYNAENQLISASGTNLSASFTYDGDGKQVKSVINGVTTLYVGAHYELQGAQVTKYYFAGAQRVAMRRYTIPQSMTVEYLLGDHLGSTSLTTDANGNKISELHYCVASRRDKPWGEVRSTWTSALVTTPAYKLMDYTFTGQRSYMDDPTTPGATEGFGLMFYGARWYDPYLNHFTQPDTIIPDPYNSQDWDRYAYARNNPVRYTDPSGHCVVGGHDMPDSSSACNGREKQSNNVVVPTIDDLLNGLGATLSDDGGKKWDDKNKWVLFRSLRNINDALNGHLKDIIGGATFKLAEYHPTDDCTTCTYSGWTSGTNITFYTTGNAAIRPMNIYHEVGHLLDNTAGDGNVFSSALRGLKNPSFITGKGYLDRDSFTIPWYLSDGTEVVQHPYSNVLDADKVKASEEQWGDIFANYVAGNIKLGSVQGSAMNEFITQQLAPFIGAP